MTTPQFAMSDTRKPDGFYVQFKRVILDDETADRPDEMQEGFWPSQDPNAAGYCGPCTAEKFAEHERNAKQRMTDYESGHWSYVGVRARALCLIVHKGVGVQMSLESPGIWGIESDSGDDYLNETYEEEIATLKDLIAAMINPIYE